MKILIFLWFISHFPIDDHSTEWKKILKVKIGQEIMKTVSLSHEKYLKSCLYYSYHFVTKFNLVFYHRITPL
jgi:hypothetical protein